ncbi:hypothetical protein [Campylobacter ureolyticus]|uniref:hypothetical protein n=1 Tax=Campylobacter ureolyticus TaxID=827 RepID=UPI001FC7C96C|nr:hypothetical protein [Campylobacter ureolyticus]MCZ6106212.1 hypothetical protein [Campylobacter ureolyticus]MCZ6158767.1 hypothetical protein [Campylobacter ureolyticus]GKH60353.1 hypothetical protein CE91St25_06890 [Campylobacter ureolyticus]
MWATFSSLTLKDIDTIEFTSKNITKESLNFSKDKNDLLIVKDELNSIRVKDYFLLNYNKEPVNAINTIKFANKTTLSIEDIDKLLISNSSDKNDEISTISSKNFTINAKGGDDTKRYKFIQNLKNKIKSNQIITKKIYNFKSYKFAA